MMNTYYFSVIMENGNMDSGFVAVPHHMGEMGARMMIKSQYGRNSIIVELLWAHNGTLA